MRHSDRWNPLQENENITDVQTSANVIISNTQRHGKSCHLIAQLVCHIIYLQVAVIQ